MPDDHITNLEFNMCRRHCHCDFTLANICSRRFTHHDFNICMRHCPPLKSMQHTFHTSRFQHMQLPLQLPVRQFRFQAQLPLQVQVRQYRCQGCKVQAQLPLQLPIDLRQFTHLDFKIQAQLPLPLPVRQCRFRERLNLRCAAAIATASLPFQELSNLRCAAALQLPVRQC